MNCPYKNRANFYTMELNMTENEKDILIDKFLSFLNDSIEEKGSTVNLVHFNLTPNSDDSKEFLLSINNSISYNEFLKIVNICLSRSYIKRNVLGRELLHLTLTSTGQGRALSVKSTKPKNDSAAGNIHINVMNNHGTAQIGNNNTQNINIVLNSIMEAIEKSDASAADKAEVKSYFTKFIEHPLTNSVIGAASTIFSANLGK